jgi:molybdopterin converting factor small subunit
MMVLIPTPLQSYTGRQCQVEAEGATLAELLCALDRTYPGLRFRIITEQDRIRPHIKIFVNDRQVRDLHVPLATTDRVQIICALSGG